MTSRSLRWQQTPRDREILAALDLCPLEAADMLQLSETFQQPFTSLRRVKYGRKFGVRFVFGFQGVEGFTDGVDSRFLRTITGQCGTLIGHRMKGESDRRFFGGHMVGPYLSAHRIKHEQETETQWQDEPELRVLVDTSEAKMEGKQKGGSASTAVTDSTQWSDTDTDQTGTTRNASESLQSDVLQPLVNDIRTKMTGDTYSNNHSHGSTNGGGSATQRQEGSNWSLKFGRSWSISHKQAFVPRFVTKRQVTATQFYTRDDILMEMESKFPKLRIGQALVYVSGVGVAVVQFPLSKVALQSSPRRAARKRTEFYAQLHARPEYRTAEEILAIRREFLTTLVTELQATARKRHGLEHSLSPPPMVPMESPQRTALLIEPIEVPLDIEQLEIEHAPWKI
jgi:hypothetical protein